MIAEDYRENNIYKWAEVEFSQPTSALFHRFVLFRKSRNLSEKRRRDAFNLLVTELSTLVTVGERKLDKSNVLKQTIAYLKKYNREYNKPSLISSISLTQW